MKISTYSTIIFFILYFIYKLFGNNNNDYWVNGFWNILSVYLSIVSFQLSIYFFDKKISLVWKLAGTYWLTMSLIHAYFIFDIDRYEIYANAANTITIGCILIFGMFAILFIKTFKK